MLSILRQAAADFSDDDCPTMASSLTYYTVFSLPPLLFLIVTLAGLLLDPATVQGQIVSKVDQAIGPAAAEQIQTMLRAEAEGAGRGGLAMILSFAAVVFAATGAFVQLQTALNRAWEVKPDPDQGGVMKFIAKRLLSFGMILGVAFLLLVSLAVTAAASTLALQLSQIMPRGGSEFVVIAGNFVASLVVMSCLFAAIFKWMPDAQIEWRDVWTGAITTAVLFEIGKLLIGLYLGHSNAK